MEKALILFILILMISVFVVAIIQTREKRKVQKGIKSILRWFDFIVRHPHRYDIEKIRELGDEVDKYFAETGVGEKIMYFSPKLREYIVDRFGREEGETLEQAFERLTNWEADRVKLDVYWTLIRGNFAEYLALKEKGEERDFVKISAPISIIRRYWRV